MHKTFYYARVSTREQKLDRQLEVFRKLGAEEREIITDKESGKNLDRPGYQALKSAMLCPGDVLVVKSLDRLSRSKADIKNELQWFIDLPDGQAWVFEMVNNILIEMLDAIAKRNASQFISISAMGTTRQRPNANTYDDRLPPNQITGMKLSLDRKAVGSPLEML